jgi:four helix bundle protein
MSEIKSYRDLRVWQNAVDFVVKIYSLTGDFPQSEIYGLTGQMRRSSVSIPSNIAEGHVRTRRDYGRFLTIALSSLAELETQMEIARRIGFMSQDDFDELSEELAIIGKQLNVLTTRIRRSRPGTSTYS